VGLVFRSDPDNLESSRSDDSSSVSNSKAVLFRGSSHTNPLEIGFRGGGRVRLSNEDVDVSDRNDSKLSRVFSSRHLEVILWDNGEAGIVEDAPDGDGVADACEGGSRLDPRS
jgi:hypothetical protein